jgi:cell wall-associated NlpC family hydrolase
VMAATRAVQEAEMEGADITKAAGELQAVKQEQQAQLATLFQRLPTTPASIRKEVATAVQQSKAPSQQVTPRRNTTTPPTSTAAPGPVPAGSPSTTTLGAATTTQPTTTTTEPTTTTTTEPTTTSEPPTTVAPENTTGSLEQQGQDEQAPPSSAGP